MFNGLRTCQEAVGWLPWGYGKLTGRNLQHLSSKLTDLPLKKADPLYAGYSIVLSDSSVNNFVISNEPLIRTSLQQEQNTQKKSHEWCCDDAIHCAHVNCKSLFIASISIWSNATWSLSSLPLVQTVVIIIWQHTAADWSTGLGSSKYRQWLLRASKRKGIFQDKEKYGHLIARHISCLSAVLKEMTSLSK